MERPGAVKGALVLRDGVDPDVADELLQVFGSEGISVIATAEIVNVHGRSGHGVKLFVRTSHGERTIAGSDILVAAGRTPNTAGIGFEIAGVDLDQRGYVKVNDRLETTARNVWAIGECAGPSGLKRRTLNSAVQAPFGRLDTWICPANKNSASCETNSHTERPF